MKYEGLFQIVYVVVFLRVLVCVKRYHRRSRRRCSRDATKDVMKVRLKLGRMGGEEEGGKREEGREGQFANVTIEFYTEEWMDAARSPQTQIGGDGQRYVC